MKISIAQGHNPPHNINGITVIIDVIRAFTTSHEAFLGGASHIYPVSSADDAFRLREDYREGLLVGEVQALPIEGFDHGNSPWEIRHTDVRGRYLIMRTTNGVAATLRARLEAGDYDAAITEALLASTTFSNTNLAITVLGPPLERIPLGMGFWKGDLTLKRAVQSTIANIRADGTLTRLADRYDLDADILCPSDTGSC
jgi:hypothetical protein